MIIFSRMYHFFFIKLTNTGSKIDLYYYMVKISWSNSNTDRYKIKNNCFNPNLKILGHQKTQNDNIVEPVKASSGVR